MNENRDPEQVLRQIAPALDSLRGAPGARYRYDAITQSILWDDEIPKVEARVMLGALRALLAHRASLMMGEPDLETEQAWRLGKTLFPNWIGFSPNRVHPSQGIVDFLRDSVEKTRAAIERMRMNIPRRLGKQTRRETGANSSDSAT